MPPKTMKAMVLQAHGGLEQLSLQQVPVPQLGPRDVLLRVRACGMNHLDLWGRYGRFADRPRKVPLPFILGAEPAGEVAAVGADVAGWKVGDRISVFPMMVCDRCAYCRAGREYHCLNRQGTIGPSVNGGYAEYCRVPASSALHLPEGLAFTDAAAVALAGRTSWHALVRRARLQPGESVLVHAAGSGVGSLAIQIAKLMGASLVITTASTDVKLRKAKAIGADIGINYATQDFAKEVKRVTSGRGVDVVVEHVGATTWAGSIASLAPEGRLVVCGATSGGDVKLALQDIYYGELDIIGTFGGTRVEQETVLRMAAEGRIKPVIHKLLPLERAAEGHTILENRKVFGKVVLTV